MAHAITNTKIEDLNSKAMSALKRPAKRARGAKRCDAGLPPAEEQPQDTNDAVTVVVAKSKRRLRKYGMRTREEYETWLAEQEANEAVWAEYWAAREREAARFWLSSRNALRELGKNMPRLRGRRAFSGAGCVAAIISVVEDGYVLRDEIVREVAHRHRFSYRHVGFTLTRLTGDDPSQHLWMKDEDRRYRLVGFDDPQQVIAN